MDADFMPSTGSLEFKRVTQGGVGRILRGERGGGEGRLGEGREEREEEVGSGLSTGCIVIFAYPSPDTSYYPSSWRRAEAPPETVITGYEPSAFSPVSVLTGLWWSPRICTLGRVMLTAVVEPTRGQNATWFLRCR